MYQLQTGLWLPRPPEEVFAFFADAYQLENLTPPWLQFRVLTPPPIEMRAGALIDYRLRLHGWPVRWQTEIEAWEPPRRFVDRQLRGPYKTWIHEHLFTPQDGGVLVQDHVRYAVPGGRLVHALFVQRDVQAIFDYRRRRLEQIFAAG